jgi:hypothetical protein
MIKVMFTKITLADVRAGDIVAMGHLPDESLTSEGYDSLTLTGFWVVLRVNHWTKEQLEMPVTRLTWEDLHDIRGDDLRGSSDIANRADIIIKDGEVIKDRDGDINSDVD